MKKRAENHEKQGPKSKVPGNNVSRGTFRRRDREKLRFPPGEVPKRRGYTGRIKSRKRTEGGRMVREEDAISSLSAGLSVLTANKARMPWRNGVVYYLPEASRNVDPKKSIAGSGKVK